MNEATPRHERIQIARQARTILGTPLSRRRANHPVREQVRIRRCASRDYQPMRREKIYGGNRIETYLRLYISGYTANSKIAPGLASRRALDFARSLKFKNNFAAALSLRGMRDSSLRFV